VSGSDGCNKLTGAYQVTGDAVTFGPLAGTEMACADIGNIDHMFQAALKTAERITRAGDRLEFSDATGRRVAAFVAATPPGRSSPAAADLTGTSWRLVMFQGGDGQTLTPDDRSKYTVDFASGRVNTRLDCNRGSATWKSRGSNQLRLGTLASTHADCPAGSLHDQIVSQWGNVRSYVIKNGHLFLSLMADGGLYELEPVIKEPRPMAY
jgi:heat shock protein HslJ